MLGSDLNKLQTIGAWEDNQGANLKLLYKGSRHCQLCLFSVMRDFSSSNETYSFLEHHLFFQEFQYFLLIFGGVPLCQFSGILIFIFSIQ